MSTPLTLGFRIAVGRLLKWASQHHLLAWLRPIVPGPLENLYRRALDLPPVFRILGSWVYVPPCEQYLRQLGGTYEPPVVAVLSKLLTKGLTFCDVGANIGVLTLYAARLVGPRGLVIAIEPVPENVDILRRNVAMNGYQNVMVLQSAAGRDEGVVTIHLSGALACHSLFVGPPSATGRTLAVQALRLDSLPEMRHVSVLKIDVEGAELLVLNGLGALRPTNVVLEYNTERQQAAGISGARFIEELHALGYRKISDLDDPDEGLERISRGDSLSHNLHLRIG